MSLPYSVTNVSAGAQEPIPDNRVAGSPAATIGGGAIFIDSGPTPGTFFYTLFVPANQNPYKVTITSR
jgi:hypothetical protein